MGNIGNKNLSSLCADNAIIPIKKIQTKRSSGYYFYYIFSLSY